MVAAPWRMSRARYLDGQHVCRTLAVTSPVRILLLAPDLLAESLALQLTAADESLR